MNRCIRIGNRSVGEGQPCFIVAEIGINHNGDVNLGKQIIKAAADAGADSVKLQNYHTEDFISDRTITYSYQSQGKEVTESQWELFKRYELSTAQLRELKTYADSIGIHLHSTPTGRRSLQTLLDLGIDVLKNGSDYLGNLPFIELMGRTALPTIISTGMATLAEIDDAVRAFRSTGNDQLILLHCTSSYPTPDSETHLRKLTAISAAFGCLVGFSDHTEGICAAIGSVVLGACLLEKHFTLDRTLPGPDHRFSSDPEELATLVRAVRAIERQLGGSSLAPTKAEEATRIGCRLSCVAATALPKGHELQEDDIVFRRPGTGYPPSQRHLLVGRKLHHSVREGDVITAAFL